MELRREMRGGLLWRSYELKVLHSLLWRNHGLARPNLRMLATRWILYFAVHSIIEISSTLYFIHAEEIKKDKGTNQVLMNASEKSIHAQYSLKDLITFALIS